MKLIFSGIVFLLLCGNMLGQPRGKVVYERTLQLQIAIANDNSNTENMLPRSHKDRFVLLFGNNQSLWKMDAGEMDPDGSSTWNASAGGDGGGRIQIRMFGMGSEDVTFNDFGKSRKVELLELGTKKYIVNDSTRSLKWKLTGQTKTILGHSCSQAVAQRTGTRVMMNMDNGKMERKEIPDTSEIVAWFANDIPISAGPADFQGQLPGLVLEVDINNGRQSYQAVSISPDVDLAEIKEPKGARKITREEFDQERKKLLDEMERNNTGGGRRVIRIGQ